jgi:hypothetical protein
VPRARRLLLVAVLAASLAVPTAQDAGAGPCAADSGRSIAGTVRGVDDRFVNVTIGLALHDSAGRLINRFGCPIVDAYADSTSLNQTAPLEGAEAGDESFTFATIPANAASFWIEHYPRRPSPYRTDRSAYGGVLLRAQPLEPVGTTSVALVAPIACGRPGGTTGGIEVHAFLDGAPAGLVRVAAWSESPDPEHRRGWGVDSPAAPHPSVWTISSLEAGQRYTVRATIDGQAARVTYGVPVRACENTEIWVWAGTPPPGLPSRWASEGFAVGGDFRPVVGDLDGDGRDDIVWHGPGSDPDRLWRGGDSGFTTSSLAVQGTYWPVSEDLDGNGVDDILWYGPGAGPDALWLFQPGGAHTVEAISAGATAATRAYSGDFDGNGYGDILFYVPTGASVIWWHGPEGRTKTRLDTYAGRLPAVTDIDGDGHDDIAWHNPANGNVRLQYGHEDRTFSAVVEQNSPDGQPLGGDLDGDLRGDLLLFREGPGFDHVWRGLDRRTPPRFAKEATSAGVQGAFARAFTGDFDGNSTSDLFFYAPGPTADRLRWGDPTGWYQQVPSVSGDGAELAPAATSGAPVGATSPL